MISNYKPSWVALLSFYYSHVDCRGSRLKNFCTSMIQSKLLTRTFFCYQVKKLSDDVGYFQTPSFTTGYITFNGTAN